MSVQLTVPEKHLVGRPPKLNPEVMQNIVALIRQGVSYGSACRTCGISRNTRMNWMKHGEKEAERIGNGEPPDERESSYLAFYLAAEQADALAEAEDVRYIRESPSWRARAWLLAHKYPDRWGSHPKPESVEEKPQFQGVKCVLDYCNGELFSCSPVSRQCNDQCEKWNILHHRDAGESQREGAR